MSGLSAGNWQGTETGKTPRFLRILATSDLHMQILPWDYHSDQPSPARGLARTAGLIAGARAEADCCLLLDNGDFLQGSPMGDLLANAPSSDTLHPMIAAMNRLGYDAATLGNHEFSHGLAFLQRSLRGAAFPVVSANIAHRLGARPCDDRHLVPPFVVLSRDLVDDQGQSHPLKIGVIGFAPPQTAQWESLHLQDTLRTRDILEAAAALVPLLRAEGVDIVVALSHSGIGMSVAEPGMENATAALAALPGIDALIGGHTHQMFPSAGFATGDGVDPLAGTLQGKPAVMPGFYGGHLGVIDLALAWQGGHWRLTGHRTELRPIARRTEAGVLEPLTQSDPAIEALAEAAHQATRQWARLPVARIPQRLHSYFALVAACPAVRVVAQAQAAHVALALQGTEYAGLPVISAAAPYRAGGRGGPENYTMVDTGAVVMRQVSDLYFHANAIAALRLSGAELADWLERSAGIYRQIKPGAQDAALIAADFPSFNFDMLEGLTYQIDLAQPARFDGRGAMLHPKARRIVNLCHAGKPLDPDAAFVLATNSYRSAGSGGFAGATPDRVILSGPAENRDILQHHLVHRGSAAAHGPANWCFVPMPGTTVTFVSAPAAQTHLDDVAGLKIEPLGMTRGGFRRFRLHL